MGLKKVVVLSMAVVLLLVAVSTSVSAARADPVPDILELLSAKNQHYSKSSAGRVVRGKNARGDKSEACCETCLCKRTTPPLCACIDRFQGNERCSGCDLCHCTRNWPPICTCLDVGDSCNPPCFYSAPTTTTNENEAANILDNKYAASN